MRQENHPTASQKVTFLMYRKENLRDRDPHHQLLSMGGGGRRRRRRMLLINDGLLAFASSFFSLFIRPLCSALLKSLLFTTAKLISATGI
jgi:hypothetical protein